jgi:hypothetical protein
MVLPMYDVCRALRQDPQRSLENRLMELPPRTAARILKVEPIFI